MKLKFRSLFTSTNEEDCIPLPIFKSIESLFEQEDTLFRCKQLTDSHLLQFLSKNVTILTLLEYVTLMVKGGITPSILPSQALDELKQKASHSGFGSFCNTSLRSATPDSPSDSSDEKSQEDERFNQFLMDRLHNKYPYMATEMICSIIGKYHILPRIVEDEVLLGKFLAVLNYPKEEIIRNSAKQYMRILGNISMNSDFHYNLFSYFYKQDGLPLLNLLKFSDYASDRVAEILKSALLFTPSSFRKSSTNLHKLTNEGIQETKMGVVQQMIRSMTSDFNLEVVKTAVIELLGTDRPSDLVDCIIKKDSFNVITTTLFQNANDSSIADAIMEIIRKILFVARNGDEVIEEIFALIEKFADILVNPSDFIQPVQQVATGEDTFPFGLFRLSIIEFFKFLFENLDSICERNTCNIKSVDSEQVGEDKTEETSSSRFSGESYVDLLKRLDIVNTFIKIFYTYPNNNIVHYQITYIILHILSAKPNSPTSQFIEPLVKGENSIIPRLISEVMQARNPDTKKTSGKAYIGHLTQIGYAISDLEIDEDEMEEMFSGWNDFYKYLKDRHFVETVYCHGGDIPLPQNMIDWEEDDSDDEFGIHETADEFDDEFDNDDIESKLSRLNIQEDDEFMDSPSSVDHEGEEEDSESGVVNEDDFDNTEETADASREKQDDYDWYLDSNENE